MSCGRMENKILGYIDGRLKASEHAEMEKHLAMCAACSVRVNEFRAVGDLLGELPAIEPSAAFDVRVRALVAAEPVKQSWWAWLKPSARPVFAAAMLIVAVIWLGGRAQPDANQVAQQNDAQIEQDLPVLENYDVLTNFEPLSDLSQGAQTDDSNQQDADTDSQNM
ncbi:MAG TPA: zf-HC2 domain-containing protein [Candidatus Saccharimonadales bacterium]|nr:zf-HC2 domain-containing protein [Candidatus Saccharimonadales bacterium]